jgi:hypothetical protein
MISLDFDQRHTITLFNARGAEYPFPYEEGVLLQITFGMEKHSPIVEILNEVAPNAEWYAWFFPGAQNELFDSQTGTMFLEVKNLRDPSNAHPLRWEIDHENALLAVATPENETGELESLSLADNERISITMEVEEVFSVPSGQLIDSTKYYAKLKPSGEIRGNLIRCEILIVDK